MKSKAVCQIIIDLPIGFTRDEAIELINYSYKHIIYYSQPSGKRSGEALRCILNKLKEENL